MNKALCVVGKGLGYAGLVAAGALLGAVGYAVLLISNKDYIQYVNECAESADRHIM